MKKVMLIAVLLLFAVNCWGFDKSKFVSTLTLTWYDSSSGNEVISLSASGSAYSQAIKLTDNTGYASLQINLSGSGSLTAKYYMSNDGINYVVPSGASNIFTDITAGNHFSSVLNPVGEYMKIYVEETGGANSVTPVGILAIQ